VFDVKSIEYFSTGSGTDSSVFTPWLAINEAKVDVVIGKCGVADGKGLEDRDSRCEGAISAA